MIERQGGVAGVSGSLARAATIVAGASLVGMALVEGWQVFARYVLNDSPSWTEPSPRSDEHGDDDRRCRGNAQRRPLQFFIAVEAAPRIMRRMLLAVRGCWQQESE
jgi:hypothetical protein